MQITPALSGENPFSGDVRSPIVRSVLSGTERIGRSHSFKIAVLVIATTIVAMVGSTVLQLANSKFFSDDFAPLYGTGYTEKQPVISPAHEDGVMPVVLAGEAIVTTAVKCSHEDHVGVSGVVILRRVQPPPIPAPIPLFSGSRVADKGCDSFSYVTNIPADLAPGIYEVGGSEIATRGGTSKQQSVTWVTESFEVVSGESNER